MATARRAPAPPLPRADARSRRLCRGPRGGRAPATIPGCQTALIEPLLDAFPGPMYLVGHDYGAAVALKLAHRRCERIGGLVLYEPTPFGLLLGDPESGSVALEIAVLRRVLARYVEAGDWFRAALLYVDHCSGGDAWEALSTQERAAIAWRMPELCAELDAQLKDPTPLAGFARIDVPVRLLTGPAHAPSRNASLGYSRAPCLAPSGAA